MEMYGMTGERLGTIGQAEPKVDEQLLSWQKEMNSKPSISIRKGYAANYDPPYEDASVLVVTAQSGKFVDIRFPIEMTEDKTTIEEKKRRPRSSYKAFWAFTGIAETTFYTSKSGGQQNSVDLPYSAHVVFKHEIDSKGPGIIDEGDMFLLPNGDTMEVGMDTDPKTGKVRMYKEYWTAPELTGQTTAEVSQPLSKVPCVVMETTNKGKGRGMLIRIGDYCQGIYTWVENQHPEDLVAVRTERRSSQWIMDPRSDTLGSGGEHLPLQIILEADKEGQLEVNDKIPWAGDEWVVSEIQW